MKVCSMFSQLLPLVDRWEFDRLVRSTGVGKGQKGFSSWDQFVALLFCQLGHAHSLREIHGGLASCVGKLVHLGMKKAPAVSTLSYANGTRSYVFFEELFYVLLKRLAADHKGRHKFRFKNKLLSIDASVIDLSLSLYDWADYRRTKGAVKLHLQLDHDGHLPCFAVVTEGKTHEVTVARGMQFERGTIVVMDRGYNDYGWFDRLSDDGVFFVTRLKSNAAYSVVEELALPHRRNLLSDQIIVFKRPGHDLNGAGQPHLYRRVRVLDDASGEILEFLTNNLRLSPATIAAIYKDRWQIELFFKALKQNLKIKTFLGTSANAVKTQIWTALIAMLLIKYLQLKSTYKWSLSNLVALLRMNLFVHRDLWDWLDWPMRLPPDIISTTQASFEFE